MSAIASAPVDNDIMKEPSSMVETKHPAEGETTGENNKDTPEVAPEATSESSGPRRSSRLGMSSSKPPPPPPVEKKKRGPKKRTVDESEKDVATAGNGSAKKTKTETGLAIGELLPAVTLKNEKDEDVNVQDLVSDSGLVLFLVPRADTPGCTQQACGFRDIYPDFQAVNYKVYCLSADSPSAQTKWQTKKSLPYPLLSDPSRELIGALTSSTTKTPRSHFVFEKGGKLVDRKMPVKPVDSPKLAIAFIKEHSGSSNADAPKTDS